MRNKLLQIVQLIFVFALFTLDSTVKAEASTTPEFSGNWQGQWSNPSGYIYSAEMQLSSTGDGNVLGQIHWTLKQSPRAEEQSKIAMTGTEFISGTYDQVNQLLVFKGISKTDPNNILGLDKYKLLLADNGNVMGGITWNNGSWSGVFSLVRAGGN